MRARPTILLLLLLLLPAARASADLDRAVRLAGEADSAAEFQALVAEGVAAGGTEASAWELLDLWQRLERGKDADPLPVWRAWRDRWPASGYRDWADWWCSRALVRAGRFEEAAALLPELAAASSSAELRRRASALGEALLDGPLGAARAEALAARMSEPGRSWLAERIGARRVRRRLGLVLPLKGEQAALGRQLLTGAEAALKALPGWSLDVADCESDPVLALTLLRGFSNGGRVDAVLLPGDPACVAAAGFGSRVPVLLPWYEGHPLADADDALFQCNADEETLAEGWAALLVDSLDTRQLVTFAPATRRGRRLVERTVAKVRQRRPDIELGMPQWYFPGAQDLRRQLENVAIYENSFDSLSVSLVVGRDADMGTLVPQLAWANPAHVVVGGAAFLSEGARVPELASLAGQLLVLSDWWPDAEIPAWQRFGREQEIVAGRAPTSLEAQGFEAVRVAGLCGESAAASGRGFRATLETLDLPSVYGGRLRVERHQNASLRLLAWDGRRFRDAVRTYEQGPR